MVFATETRGPLYRRIGLLGDTGKMKIVKTQRFPGRLKLSRVHGTLTPHTSPTRSQWPSHLSSNSNIYFTAFISSVSPFLMQARPYPIESSNLKVHDVGHRLGTSSSLRDARSGMLFECVFQSGSSQGTATADQYARQTPYFC